MPKPILGDDPFQPKPGKDEAAAQKKEPPPAPRQAKRAPGKAGKGAGAQQADRVEKVKADRVEKAKADKVQSAKADKVEKAKADKVEKAKADRVQRAKADKVEKVKADRVEKASGARGARVATPKKKPAPAQPIAAAPEAEAAPEATVGPGAEAPAAAPEPAPQPAEPASEYGPSIDHMGDRSADREGRPGERREVGRRAVDALASSEAAAATEEPPRKLPFEFALQHWRAYAMRGRSEQVDEFGLDPRAAARLEPLLSFFYKTWFRVATRGLGNVPDDGRGLLVANHSGTLPYDAAMLMHAVRSEHPARREVRSLVEDFVFHFPFLGTLMNRIGGVRACQENAERLLEQDQLVAVFPEGIKGIGKLYAQRYKLQRFGRGGFVKLALKTDAPIIPAAIIGAEEANPMLTKITWLTKGIGLPYLPITPTFPLLGPIGLLPMPTRWTIVFGEPLYFNAEYGADAAHDRILVNKLAEQVRQKIQEMIDAVLAERRSIIWG